MLRFVGHVRSRLERRGYTQKHALYRAVNAAFDGLHSLHIAAHYESCERGVGRSERDEE
jgi:hypothetical protein